MLLFEETRLIKLSQICVEINLVAYVIRSHNLLENHFVKELSGKILIDK